jgi:sporulation protein YlmC with PRC-barrel domain
MKNRMFSRELIGKDVETITGRTVGKLDDIVIDTDDGSIKYLLVSASGNVMGGPHKVDEEGRFVVETDRIRVDGDRLIIN